MSTHYLPTVEVEPSTNATRSVIWLHGLGADGHDFESVVPHLGLPADHTVRFVFPHAPQIPVTINGGMVMRAWYDITEADLERRQDTDRIRASGDHVADLIAREVERGVSEDRIVLAGFSQGGAIALHRGLRHPRRLAGLMALSTYLLLPETTAAERTPANADTPVFMGHGEYDPMVPMTAGLAARELLQDLGYEVQWHAYPMQHQVCMEEIEAIGGWLRRVLGPGGAGTRNPDASGP